ncbi:hypothetical protein LQ318_08730 [Aliifodinibius salicampi]|uniref:Uncharacterized protein n=1 Tax=Fodinibius salicampi TaxID=1920655 RepID=A0ABT3PYS9_9BACT|nr:hypothetical protein [Fodinibius salicampi]MCW9712989.1 hypothetical protein [Fodinibius salicampi]
MATSEPLVSDSNFKVFDGTNFTPKPDELAESGMDYFVMANTHDMWGKSPGQLQGTTTLPDQELINEFANNAILASTELSISIPHWSLTGNDTEVQEAVSRYINVIDQFKETEPNLNIGLYRSIPIHKVSRSTKPTDSDAYQSWIEMNTRLQSLADQVDIFYPSLYTYTDDREKWVTDAKEQIKLAHELNGDNPVYVILWPKYHPYYDGYEDRAIEQDFWQLQLETARKYADGVVIATPGSMEWDNTAPWWNETQQFLTDLGKTSAPDYWDSIELPVVSDSEFKVLDGTNFRPKPDELTQSGIEYFKMANSSEMWGQSLGQLRGTITLPDKELVNNIAHDAALGPNELSLNIQHWPLTGNDTEVQEAMNRYVEVINWLNEAEPNLDVGLYRSLPVQKVSRSTKPENSIAYQSWIEMNTRLQSLADQVDIFYPSLYTYTDDREKWVTDAKEQIKLAHELNGDNPVYVILWPKYHPYYDGYEDRAIEQDFWQLQLQTARKYADGVVIATPGSMEWDSTAPWWNETQQFLTDLGKEPTNTDGNFPVVSDEAFKVFDGTRYVPQPWPLDNYGLSPLRIAYPPSLWGQSTSELEGTTTMPDQEKLARIVRDATGNGTRDMVINIEHWPLEGDQETVQANLDRFMTVVDWVKAEDPDMQVGFYGVPPIRSFWNSTKNVDSGSYQEWKQQNEDLQLLADKVDAFYPSLYTFNDDKEYWVKEAKAQIEMARHLNGDNPVYVFLWPQYHPYYEEFGGRFIEQDFWELQLQTARKYADGIVLWMPRKDKEDWDNDAPWWVATRQFMVDLGKVDWAN